MMKLFKSSQVNIGTVRRNLCLALGLAVFGLAAVVLGKIAEIVDENEAVDVGFLAQTLCTSERKYGLQISRVSTINKLADLFESLPENHQFSGCRKKYGRSLRYLKEVVNRSNGDVCSDEKISLIEQFHRDYVSELRKHRSYRKANHLKIPTTLKIFFTQYVQQVSTICERTASSLVRSAASTIDSDRISEEAEEAVAKLGESVMADVRLGYSGINLVWNVIENLPSKRHDKTSIYLSDSTKKLSVSMKDASQVQKLQKFCTDEAMPIYRKVTLPVLRLIIMGFYPERKDFVELILENGLMKQLYILTHICDTIIPIRFYQDKALAPDQILVLTREKARRVAMRQLLETSAEQDDYDLKLNSMESLDKLDSVTPDNAANSAMSIKDNINSRSGVAKRLVKQAQKSKRSLYLIMSTGDDSVRAAVMPTIEEENLDDLYEDEDYERSALTRRKRGLEKRLEEINLWKGFTMLLYYALEVVGKVFPSLDVYLNATINSVFKPLQVALQRESKSKSLSGSNTPDRTGMTKTRPPQMNIRGF